MSMTDPIADLLTRLRNGAAARKEYVECPWSVMKERIVRVMIAEGFLRDVEILSDGAKKRLRIWLRYDRQQRPVLSGLERISKPSRRVYVGVDDIPAVRRGAGISILSTPQGILADREARRRHTGGELLCAVW